MNPRRQMNLPEMITLNESSDNKIIFAAVDHNYTAPVFQKGLYIFPDETMLLKFKLGRKDTIYLNELSDKNCKKCYGTGKKGTSTIITKVPVDKIKDVLLGNLDDTPENIPDELINLMELPQNFKIAADILTGIAIKELTDDNLNEIATKYAKMIKKDFVRREIIWCECFLVSLQEKIDDIRRQIKFGIN